MSERHMPDWMTIPFLVTLIPMLTQIRAYGDQELRWFEKETAKKIVTLFGPGTMPYSLRGMFLFDAAGSTGTGPPQAQSQMLLPIMHVESLLSTTSEEMHAANQVSQILHRAMTLRHGTGTVDDAARDAGMMTTMANTPSWSQEGHSPPFADDPMRFNGEPSSRQTVTAVFAGSHSAMTGIDDAMLTDIETRQAMVRHLIPDRWVMGARLVSERQQAQQFVAQAS